MSTVNRPTRAFTLIELLVVIAIVALLISILLPTLASARTSGRAVICASNNRQLVTAFTLYTDDHRGYAMPHLQTSGITRTYWYGQENIANQSLDHTQGTLTPYLSAAPGDRSVFECPEQSEDSYHTQGSTDSFTSTYGYNAYGLSPNTSGYFELYNQRTLTLAQIDRPAAQLVFADTLILLFSGLPSNSAQLDPPQLFAPGWGWRTNPSPTTAFRHHNGSAGFGRATNARADGSVHSSKHDPNAHAIGSHAIGSIDSDVDPNYVQQPARWR
jgi:prepilin-type N-terminal cleavage/methylation domain-containing protein